MSTLYEPSTSHASQACGCASKSCPSANDCEYDCCAARGGGVGARVAVVPVELEWLAVELHCLCAPQTANIYIYKIYTTQKVDTKWTKYSVKITHIGVKMTKFG